MIVVDCALRRINIDHEPTLGAAGSRRLSGGMSFVAGPAEALDLGPPLLVGQPSLACGAAGPGTITSRLMGASASAEAGSGGRARRSQRAGPGMTGVDPRQRPPGHAHAGQQPRDVLRPPRIQGGSPTFLLPGGISSRARYLPTTDRPEH